MTACTLALGAAVWLVLATVVGIVTGRCLRLMEDDDE
jgi:hypothetical protein